MSGTEETFHYTKEDVAKLESRESRRTGGNIPAGSEAATLQSIVDSHSTDKAELIEERKANLPLPEQPPVPSDWNSADARTVNVGSGGQQSDISYGAAAESGLREPATGGDDAAAAVGRQAKDNLSGIPNDAVTRDKKKHSNTVDTTNKDYGYPQKNDPSNAS